MEMNLGFVVLGLGQAAAGGQPAACGGAMGTLPMMVLMFAIFYFVLIRPQQKRQKLHQAFLNNLKKGDRVITRGGLVGTVTGVADQLVTIELQEKVRVQLVRSFIDGAFTPGGAADTTSAGKSPDKGGGKSKSDAAEPAAESKS